MPDHSLTGTGRRPLAGLICRCICLLAGFGSALNGFAADALSAGPLYERFELTLTPGHRTEAVGPFYYHDQQEPQETWAVPPLMAYMRDEPVERKEFDFVYPVFTYTRFGDQYRYQFFQLLSFAGGLTQTENVRDRFSLFPIYFQQRSSDPDQNYTAVFPFYGHLKHRLFRDEIFFVMFPIYGQSRKRDVVTDNYLYPFFHLRHGRGLEGWQLWPFYGQEHKDVTTQTNGFGDTEIIPGHDHMFTLWPFFYNDRNGLGTENSTHEQGSIPFYSFMRSPQRDSTTILWPFFTKVDDRDKKYREWDFPWPLFEIARGEGKTTTRFWPLFSKARSPTLESDFLLWPIFKYDAVHAEPLERQRHRLVYFLYSDILDKNTETGKTRRQTELLPIFTRRRDFDGNIRLQVISILEPFVRGGYKIERDWAPLYTLWLGQKNPQTGASSQSLLWNLYRRDVRPDRKRVSALFGLFQYRSEPEGKQVRLFYIPIKGARRSAVATKTSNTAQ